MNGDIIHFALTNFRNQQRRFGIKRDDRRRHMYLIGKTGMGKTTVLENMMIQDVRAGHGLAVIDPHGDFVEKILDFIPSHRINDVVYINPSDVDHPVAFNVLESVNPAHRHLIASGLISVFKKMWSDSWGPRLEYILRNAILSLIEYEGSTLLGIPRILVDKGYRRKVVEKIADPVVKAFWVTEFDAYAQQFRTEAVSPIQNKIGQFLSSSLIRNIVGQPKSSFDLRQLMDGRKILLLNLAKGRIGEDNAALLGGMMITKLQMAAMSRVDIPEQERQDFYLYVDEFQNFATESFANILSEARKYRLNLILAHQYIEQLDENVQAAVFGNVGTLVCFRVGAADAEFLAKEFAPVFDETDLVNLTKYDIYLRLMIDGVASDPFSATTLPPVAGVTNNAEKVITVSRERYATKREIVEDKIRRWHGVDEIYEGQARQSFQGSNGGRGREYRPAPREQQPERFAAAPPRPAALEPIASPTGTPVSLADALGQQPRTDNRPRARGARDARTFSRPPRQQGQDRGPRRDRRTDNRPRAERPPVPIGPNGEFSGKPRIVRETQPAQRGAQTPPRQQDDRPQPAPGTQPVHSERHADQPRQEPPPRTRPEAAAPAAKLPAPRAQDVQPGEEISFS